MQGHFGADPLQRLHLEVGGAHPGLDGAEGMLDRLAPLDRLEDMFVLPAGNPALLARGALTLDSAALTLTDLA